MLLWAKLRSFVAAYAIDQSRSIRLLTTSRGCRPGTGRLQGLPLKLQSTAEWNLRQFEFLEKIEEEQPDHWSSFVTCSWSRAMICSFAGIPLLKRQSHRSG